MKLKKKLKKIILWSPIISKAVRRLTSDIPRVFMYHRFSDAPDYLGRKIDKKTFEWQLSQLKTGWNTLALGDYIQKKKNRSNPRYCVIITVDDGYYDFFDVAFPVLKSCGIPATFFATVNFVDQKIWLWHDRIWYALTHTKKKLPNFKFMGHDFTFHHNGNDSVQKIWSRMSDFCIGISDKDKWLFIEQVEKYLDIAVPEQPIKEFRAVTWEQVREMLSGSIEIGSHTLNHPILTRVDRKQLSDEVLLSKVEIEKKLNTKVKTFCYPNGTRNDFDQNVITSVKEAGYEGAVTTELPKGRNFDNYRIPRYSAGSDKTEFLWKLYGFEYLTEARKRKAAISLTRYGDGNSSIGMFY